jgi:arylsulfatase A-like enzyme
MSDARPNIIFINTDQQRGDCLSVEGHPVLLTPNMDGIAAEGVRFSHFYSGCPTCIATRRSMLSGQTAQRHGMVGYAGGIEWDAPPTLPGVLGENGYQTRLIGRSMHQHPPRKRYGFDEMETECHMGASDYSEWLRDVGPLDAGGWFAGGVMHNDWTARPWPFDDHLHFTNWVITRSLRFLERRDPSGPYFLTIGFIAPHPPLQPPAFYFERYLRTGVPDPVIGDWAVPPEFGAQRGDHVAPSEVELTGEALLSARAGYYGLINHVDDQLRRLLNPVIGLGRDLKRDTIVVFTSDHGEMLGDHHMWRKSRAYEPSARVPFLVRAPEQFGLRAASVVDEPCTHADIMPTLLEMAGVSVPETCNGRSLLPLMRGESVAWRDFVHIEHVPEHHGLTDGREKFIWDPKDGSEQFFDLTDDPTECRNRIADAAFAERVEVWRSRLIDELRDRPEGFVDGDRLVPGRPWKAMIE